MEKRSIEPDQDNLLAEELTPRDRAEWRQWIADCLDDTVRGYRAKPEWLKRDANGERSIARDYAKRELFELIQNAADAASEIGGHGRVRIEITADGLWLANTGMPFRAGGVRSLMTAHISDKPERQARLIGAKGLGFRALLNWTAEPYASSGALELGFSLNHAGREVDRLAGGDPRIARLIAQTGKPLIPILAFPFSDPDVVSVTDARLAALMKRAAELRAEGYDTVVAAPFGDSKAHAKALEQLAEFRPDFLLFVEALDEAEVLATAGNGALEVKNYICAMAAIPGARGRLIAYEAVREWICGCAFLELERPHASDGVDA